MRELSTGEAVVGLRAMVIAGMTHDYKLYK